MSDYGILASGDNGSVLIDYNRPNMAVLQTGVVNINNPHKIPGDGRQVGYKAVVPVPSQYLDTPWFVAYKIPVGKIIGLYYDRVYSWGATAQLPYAILTTSNSMPSSGVDYGVQVYNSAGQITFDSGRALFQIASTTTRSGEGTTYVGPNDWLLIGGDSGSFYNNEVVLSTGYKDPIYTYYHRESSTSLRCRVFHFDSGPYSSGDYADNIFWSVTRGAIV